MGRSMQDDLRKGKHTVNGGFRAIERDQPTTQDHGRVEGRTPNKTSNKIQSVRGIVNPMAQPTSVYNRQPAVSHPSKVPMQPQRPLDRRSQQNGGKQIQSHSGPPKHPLSPMTAQHDQARMPVDAKQLHPSPSPATPRAPSPAASEASERLMQMAPIEHQQPDQRRQVHAQSTITENAQHRRTEDVSHRPTEPSRRPAWRQCTSFRAA